MMNPISPDQVAKYVAHHKLAEILDAAANDAVKHQVVVRKYHHSHQACALSYFLCSLQDPLVHIAKRCLNESNKRGGKIGSKKSEAVAAVLEMSDERVVELLEMADAKHEIDKLRHQQEVARQQLERQSMSAAAKEGSAVESLRESVKAMHAKCRDSDERASKAEAAAAAMQEEVRAAREAVAVAETRAAKEAKEAAVARAALEAMDAETVDSRSSVRQASAEAAEAEAAAAAAEEEAKRADVDLSKRKGEHLPRGNMRSSFASIREEEGAGEEAAAPPSRPAAPAAPSSVAPSSVAPIARESDVQGEGDDSTTASPRRRQVSLMRRSVSFRDDVVATARAHAQSLARVSGGYRDYEQSATVKQQSAQVFEFLTTLATSESGGHGDAGRGAGPAVSGGVIGAFATVLWSAQESAQREEVNMKEATMAYARMPHTASRQCRAKCRTHTHTHTHTAPHTVPCCLLRAYAGMCVHCSKLRRARRGPRAVD